jgi:hypothetical protein
MGLSSAFARINGSIPGADTSAGNLQHTRVLQHTRFFKEVIDSSNKLKHKGKRQNRKRLILLADIVQAATDRDQQVLEKVGRMDIGL